MENYDIVVVGAGAGGVFLTYELCRKNCPAKVLVLEKGTPLEKRICPIKEGKTEKCVKCSPCRIMHGYGGAGTLSDGKYNITTRFGGDLHKYVGEEQAMELMEYVDDVLTGFGGGDAKLYSTGNSDLKTTALQHNLHLLDAKVRHLGTDRNRQILEKLYDYTRDRIETRFNTSADDIEKTEDGFLVTTDKGDRILCRDLVLASGRSGSRWISACAWSCLRKSSNILRMRCMRVSWFTRRNSTTM